MATVVLDKVNKVYDNSVHAVHDFSIDIKDREFIVFVGPSGCGKSTTLRMIAGLEEISSGGLYIDGKLMNNVAPKDRDIAMVFQSYALYPNMTVYGNMAFSLKIRRFSNEEMERRVELARKDCQAMGLSEEETEKRVAEVRKNRKLTKQEIDQRVRYAAKILGLTPYLDRKPAAMSGGQRQRVALGRAIVRQPKVFLMDEPLSNLDAKLRVQMRSEIVKIHQSIGATTIYVTHDQTEAMTMASRIVCMKDGFIQQIGTPEELYEHPANLFVAGFIGSPAMNFMQGTVTEDGCFQLKNNPDVKFPLLPEQKEMLKEFIGKKVTLGIRPEHLVYSPDGDYGDFTPWKFTAKVDVMEVLGDLINAHLNFRNYKIIYKGSSKHRMALHSDVTVALRIEEARFFSTGTGKAITPTQCHYEEPKGLISSHDRDYIFGALDSEGYFTIAGDSMHKFRVTKKQYKLLDEFKDRSLAISIDPQDLEYHPGEEYGKDACALEVVMHHQPTVGMNEVQCDGQPIFVQLDRVDGIVPGTPFRLKFNLEKLSFYNKFTLKEITPENNGYSENTLDDDQVDVLPKLPWYKKVELTFLEIKEMFHHSKDDKDENKDDSNNKENKK